MTIQESLTKAIIKSLDRTGMKHSSIGYQYTVSCVEEVLNSKNRCFMVREIYKRVAEKHHVQWTTVERAIRMSISRSPEPTSKKTNKELIAQIVDQLYGVH